MGYLYGCFSNLGLRINLLHFLKDYTKGSKITNLRSIYHPERRDYDVAKMGFKTGPEKT
jgi:hypothetical protein